MERFITQEQVNDSFAQALKNSMYHRMPGAVVAYHSATMTADIQPMTNDPRTDLDTGAVDPEPWPVIQNVPIAWPRFGDLVLVGPMKVGDPVTLEAFDLDPTTAFAAGAKKSTNPVNPGDVRRHGGGYWSATPTNLTGAIKDASAAAAAYILGVDGDTAQLLISVAQLIVGKAGCAVKLSGGGPAVGRVGDAVQVTFEASDAANIISPATPGNPCSASGPFTLSGTITAGSPNVTSG